MQDIVAILKRKDIEKLTTEKTSVDGCSLPDQLHLHPATEIATAGPKALYILVYRRHEQPYHPINMQCETT